VAKALHRPKVSALYFASLRPVVERGGMLIVSDIQNGLFVPENALMDD
jgi:hypothetical protein